jgi:UPF0716 family protein affecting phage T7 exclusion
MYSGRLKQSKPSSAVGLAAGVLFVGLGVFIVMPKFGAFGVVWTVMAAFIAAYHGYGLFSKRGLALYELEGEEREVQGRSTADRLSELEETKRRGLITDAEYQAQRSRIIAGI